MNSDYDPVIRELGRQAAKLCFDGSTIWRSDNYPIGCNVWGIRLHIAGDSHIVGRFLDNDWRLNDMARYVDAATLYFWKYRYSNRSLSDYSFNFGVLQAAADIGNMSDLRWILSQLDYRLRSNYAMAFRRRKYAKIQRSNHDGV